MSPTFDYTSVDGNVFSVMGHVSGVLRKSGERDKADEMQQRVSKCESYGEALSIMQEYVPHADAIPPDEDEEEEEDGDDEDGEDYGEEDDYPWDDHDYDYEEDEDEDY